MSAVDETKYRFADMSEERMREFTELSRATQGPLAQFDGAPPPAPKWFTETVAIQPSSLEKGA